MSLALAGIFLTAGPLQSLKKLFKRKNSENDFSDVVDILEAVTILSFSQERGMRGCREDISILCIYLFILHDLILKEKYIGKKLKKIDIFPNPQ